MAPTNTKKYKYDHEDAQDLNLGNTNTNNIGLDKAQEQDQDKTKGEGPNQDQKGKSLQVRSDVPNTQPNPRQEPSAPLSRDLDQQIEGMDQNQRLDQDQQFLEANQDQTNTANLSEAELENLARGLKDLSVL